MLSGIMFCMAYTLSAQSADVASRHTFAFGTKATIKLADEGSGEYSYEVIKTENFDATVDIMEIMMGGGDIFSKSIEPGHIELIICRGLISGKDDASKTTLIQKPNIDGRLAFDASIRMKGSGVTEPTSVLPLSYQACSVEMWPYHIDEMILSGYRSLPED